MQLVYMYECESMHYESLMKLLWNHVRFYDYGLIRQVNNSPRHLITPYMETANNPFGRMVYIRDFCPRSFYWANNDSVDYNMRSVGTQ